MLHIMPNFNKFLISVHKESYVRCKFSKSRLTRAHCISLLVKFGVITCFTRYLKDRNIVNFLLDTYKFVWWQVVCVSVYLVCRTERKAITMQCSKNNQAKATSSTALWDAAHPNHTFQVAQIPGCKN